MPVHRVPFLCIDARWQVKWKWLFDPWAGPNEGYAGYITAWDSVPWQKFMFEDGVERDFNYASQSQFLPSYADSGDYYHIYEACVASGLQEAYCHGCLGLVGDIIALLEADDIASKKLKVTYNLEEAGVIKAVRLRDLFFRNFEPANRGCPIVFSRPMTYKKGAPGHIGDNGQSTYFVLAENSCDGTEGLHATLLERYRREFWADAMWFSRSVPVDEALTLALSQRERGQNLLPLGEGGATPVVPDEGIPVPVPVPEPPIPVPPVPVPAPIPANAKLVVYTLACGSVPRICINGTWHHVSPLEYFPPYGDPYGYCFRGHKHVVGQVSDLPLHLGAGETNELIVEHLAIHGSECGAQVIFCLEWTEGDIIIDEIEIRRRKMAEKQGIPTSPVEHLALLELCTKKDDDAGTLPAYKFLAPEKTALTDALTLVTTKFAEWHTRSDELGEFTAQWEPLEKQAKDLIGRARNLWSMRFEEGNVYERTAGIQDTPTKKEQISKALDRIVIVSNDNAGTLAELPPALIIALQNLYTQTHDNLRNTEIARGEKTDSYQELKKAILEHGAPALRACRKYLYAVLPDGRNDELLIEWGFEPFDMPVSHKPEDQKIVEKFYDPATDIAKIRFTEDLLADEYILESAKTQSPAPPDWKPASFDVMKTQDEPFFEVGPLTEGFTFAFRARARNSAGYGGYSEIWIVEIV